MVASTSLEAIATAAMIPETPISLKGIVPIISTPEQPQSAAPPRAYGDPERVVRQLFDAYRARNVEGMVALLATDIVFEDPTFRLRETDRDGMRKMASEMRAAYADIAIDVHSMLVSRESVAAEVTIRGVTAPADGMTRRMEVRGASFFRVRNGLIDRWTDYYDFQTFTEQMGRAKPPYGAIVALLLAVVSPSAVWLARAVRRRHRSDRRDRELRIR